MNSPVDHSSAAEDLAYIRRIMEETHHAVAMRGDGFIIWSIIVLVGLLGDWLIPMRYPGWAVGILWAGLITIGWLLTWLRFRRSRSSAHVASPATRLLGAVWLACTIALVIIFFIGISVGIIPTPATNGIVATVVGIGVFLSGLLMGTRWITNLAFGWWVGAVAEFIWHGPISLLIMAILIVAFYLIPGFILNRQVQKRHPAAHQ